MRLNLRYKANNVPILSREEIENISQSVLSEIQPESLKDPQRTDLETLIRDFLKMDYEEKYLSNNALFLGLTVFNEGQIIIYNPVKRRAEYYNARKNTIIIEKSLATDPALDGRLRFTQAHEAGHALLHRRYYKYSSTLWESQMEESDEFMGAGSAQNFSDTDWLEWQANAFASDILMPAPAMKILQSRYKDLEEETAKDLLMVTASSLFQVSETAALMRMKSLGMVEKNYRPEVNTLHYLRQFRTGLNKRIDGI